MKLALLTLSLAACASTPPMTPGERSSLTMYEAELLRCQAEGREAGSYRVYEACKADAGL